MTKKEVIEASKNYMQGILHKIKQISTKRGKIEDMEMELELEAAAAIANYNGGGTGSYSSDNSPTSRKLARREYLRAAIPKEKAKLDRMGLDILNARTSICHKFTMAFRVREWAVLEALYFEGRTQQQTALKMKCSGTMVNTIKNKALLSVGSAVLGFKADGEYYEDNEMYIDFTPGQKKRIQEGITLI